MKKSLKGGIRRRFAGTTNTHSIPKFDVDQEGKPILHLNKRTMAKKALDAFKKGKAFYTYKGQQYAVPIFSEKIEE